MMSKSEQSRIADLERRVKELEDSTLKQWRDVPDDIGAEHKAHVAAFPKKTLTLKAKPLG